MSIFLFNKDKRSTTEDFISIGFWWDPDAEHKLISTINNGDITSYYLFNLIKIWQTKLQEEE